MAASSVMRKVSLRNLRAHKLRLFLTVFSIVLGTSFVAGSIVFTSTISHAFNSIFEGAAQGVAVEITPQRSTSDGVPDSVVDQLRERKQELGIDKIVTNQQGPVTIAGATARRCRPVAPRVSPPPTSHRIRRFPRRDCCPVAGRPMGRTRSSSTPRPPTRAA